MKRMLFLKKERRFEKDSIIIDIIKRLLNLGRNFLCDFERFTAEGCETKSGTATALGFSTTIQIDVNVMKEKKKKFMEVGL